jgi:O-antigen ligase
MKPSTYNRQSESVIHPNAVDQTKAEPIRFYPRIIYILFFAFAAYLVFPLIDIPLLGLSLSAPIFFVIAIACVLRPPRPWFRTYRRWILLALWLWLAITISALANGLLSGGTNLDTAGILTIIRYIYWLIVFVVTVYFSSQGTMLVKISKILGWSALILALLRWYEVARYGNLGAWTGTHLLSQNTYGVLFSTFSPFLLLMVFQENKGKRLLAWAGNFILWSAVAINGSRGSWVAIVSGLVLCLLLLTITRPRKFLVLLILLLFSVSIASIAWVALPRVSEAVSDRFSTFQNLDTEKSYLIRQLMIQKGWRLFKENPLFGVGISRFTQSSIPLDIPIELTYASQDHFDIKSSHNSYLGFLAEGGLFGAIPLLFILISIGAGSFKSALHFAQKSEFWALVVFLSVVQMSIHMWAISSITNSATWFIYGLAGATTVLYHNRKQE